MNRLVAIILLTLSALAFITCERSDMFNLAMYGVAPKHAIYLFQIGLSSGDAGSPHDADINCYTIGLPYLSLVEASSVKAFRSFSVTEEMRFLVPTQYWQYPVMGVSPSFTITMISSSWAGLWDGRLDNDINTSLEMTDTLYWWSGSNADGSVSINNCSGWNDSDSAQHGQAGGAGIRDTTGTCDSMFYLVCLAY